MRMTGSQSSTESAPVFGVTQIGVQKGHYATNSAEDVMKGAGTFREQTANRRSHAKDADMRDIVENNSTQSRPRFLKSCWLL